MKSKSNPTIEIMLELLRSAVLDRDPVIPEGTVVDWDEMMDCAKYQNIIAWIYDGISKLPKEIAPDRLQMINWGLSAQEVWSDYAHQTKVIEKLVLACSKYGVKLLLMKGAGLSKLFPKPCSRACCDIDIYPFDDFELVNSLFREQITENKGKHATFFIDGVMIENHNDFLEPNTPQKRKILHFLHESLDEAVLTSDGYYIMAPLPNLIFLLFHTLKHFYEGIMIPIRNIVDFAFFIRQNRSDISIIELQVFLHRFGLSQQFEMLVRFAEEVLHIQLEEFHFIQLQKDEYQAIEILALNACSKIDGTESSKFPNIEEARKIIIKMMPVNFSFQIRVKRLLKNLINYANCLYFL